MSVQAMTWVIDNSEHSLGSFIVLLMIANYAKADGTGAWPSIETIARDSRLSESQTHRCIRKLKRSGELLIEVGIGPHGTNLYHLPKIKQLGLNATPSKLLPLSSAPKNRAEMAPDPSLSVIEKERGWQFDDFWNAYPRKLGKQKAHRAWLKNFYEGHLGEVLLSLAAWKELPQWADPQFIPYPATWLNEKRFKEIPAREEGRNGASRSNPTKADERRARNAEARSKVFGSAGSELDLVRGNLSSGT